MTTGRFAAGNGARGPLNRHRARTRKDLIAEGGRFRPPLRAYLGAMVVMFVVVSGVGVVYERARSTRDAAGAATRDAEFGAGAAARQISLDLRSVRAMVSGLAANPQIPRSFDPASPACALEYSGDLSLHHRSPRRHRRGRDGRMLVPGDGSTDRLRQRVLDPRRPRPVVDLGTGRGRAHRPGGRRRVGARAGTAGWWPLSSTSIRSGLACSLRSAGPGDSSSWWSPVTVSLP